MEQTKSEVGVTSTNKSLEESKQIQQKAKENLSGSKDSSEEYYIAAFVGNPVYPFKNPKVQNYIDDIKASGFTGVIVWSIHIAANGDLVLNDERVIASGGSYVGEPTWAGYLTQLKEGKTSVKHITFSVGSADVHDFQHIYDLYKKEGLGPDSVLYRNFASLKKEIPVIDCIDLDTEDLYDKESIVAFCLMMGKIGYSAVSFCPYQRRDFWLDCLKAIDQEHPGLVTHWNLQCYCGGARNNPSEWQKVLEDAGFKIPIYPGVWNSQYNYDGDDPMKIRSQYAAWREGRHFKGGFVWLYDYMWTFGPPSKAYASAIRKGLTTVAWPRTFKY